MPLPLAPLLPLALRLGALTTTVFAVRRALAARTHVGRTDQRAEDAMDAMGEGLAFHRPADRADDDLTQTNSAGRIKRTIRFGKRGLEIDAAFLARFRLRRV